MSRQSIKDFRSRQQVKDEQINYFLADVEKKIRKIQNRP